MNKFKTKNKSNGNSFIKRLKLKLFFSEMPTAKVLTQCTLAGLLIAVAAIIERFVMIKAGPFSICFGFFIILMFPLLLDFRISVIAAMISATITELAITGEGTFWIHYLPILISFPIIKVFMLFDKKWLFSIGLISGMTIYVLVATLEMKLLFGSNFEIIFMASKALQMIIAIPIALMLYFPIKRALPMNTDNSWEKDLCCEDCAPSVNKVQQCCDDNCQDECRNK